MTSTLCFDSPSKGSSLTEIHIKSFTQMIDLGLKRNGAKFCSLKASFHLVRKSKRSEDFKHFAPIRATSYSTIFDIPMRLVREDKRH